MAYYEYEFPQQKVFEVKDLPLANNCNRIYIDSENHFKKTGLKLSHKR